MSDAPKDNKDLMPVSAGEYLLRRIPSDNGQYDFVKNEPRFGAFVPNKADLTGISLYRESLITAEGIRSAARSEKVRLYGGILAVALDTLTELGLHTVEEPSDLPGHVVIPELSRPRYESDKEACQKIAQLLARRAVVRICPTVIPPDP